VKTGDSSLRLEWQSHL